MLALLPELHAASSKIITLKADANARTNLTVGAVVGLFQLSTLDTNIIVPDNPFSVKYDICGKSSFSNLDLHFRWYDHKYSLSALVTDDAGWPEKVKNEVSEYNMYAEYNYVRFSDKLTIYQASS